jgi:hypothetical protein
VTAGAVIWAGARIEITIIDLNFVDPGEISTASAREYMSQAQHVVSKRGNLQLPKLSAAFVHLLLASKPGMYVSQFKSRVLSVQEKHK